MRNDDTIFVSRSDLNYNGQTTAQVMTRDQFFRLVKWDGRYLHERISPTAYRRIKYREVRKEYDRRMTERYGRNWMNNRYLMEEVRITAN